MSDVEVNYLRLWIDDEISDGCLYLFPFSDECVWRPHIVCYECHVHFFSLFEFVGEVGNVLGVYICVCFYLKS